MFNIIKKIMSPEEAKQLIYLSPEMKVLKEKRDGEVNDIISGKDGRLLIIIGPCSADSEKAVLEYVSRLAVLSEKVKDKILLVPRLYTNKPRTRGEGYKGMMHTPDPHHCGETDIQAGILSLRSLHQKAISLYGMPAADEMLYPDNADYIADLLSYIAVGARSSENQQHRLVASGFDVATGIKNPMNGSFSVLLNSVYAAQLSNEFKYGQNQVKTAGNQFAHAILRGGVDVYGHNFPNYHYEDLVSLYEMYGKQNLKNPAVIIDTNHSNSNKNPFEQIRIVKEVEGNRRHSDEIKKFVKGYLIESYLLDGNQKPDGDVYGQSITDACLGWEKSERLILETAERL